MNSKIILSTLTLICLTSVSAWAGEGRARIDMYSNAKIKIEASTDKKVRVENPGWVKDELKKSQSLTVDISAPTDEWKQITISFTPEENGFGSLQLKGQWDKTKQNWTYFDDVVVEGSTLKNGDFEKNEGWKFSESAFITDEATAHSGKTAIHVWHDKYVHQSIKLTAGQKVTITAWVKFDKQQDKETK
jgi:hypothetical protein